MAVYVEDSQTPIRGRYGRRLYVSAMYADTMKELIAMCHLVDAQTHYIFHPDDPARRYILVCNTRRYSAINHGAIETTREQWDAWIARRIQQSTRTIHIRIPLLS